MQCVLNLIIFPLFVFMIIHIKSIKSCYNTIIQRSLVLDHLKKKLFIVKRFKNALQNPILFRKLC